MYKSKSYHPDNVVDAFIRYSQLHNKFYFYERGIDKRLRGIDKRFEIRQGEIDDCFLPQEVQSEAKRRAGAWPSYVKVDKAITIKWGRSE